MKRISGAKQQNKSQLNSSNNNKPKEDKRVPDPSAGLLKVEQAISAKKATDSTAQSNANSQKTSKNSKRKQTNSQAREAERKSLTDAQKKTNISGNSPGSSSSANSNGSPIGQQVNNKKDVACATLDDFTKRAQEIKCDIKEALERQSSRETEATGQSDQPAKYDALREEILKISGLRDGELVEHPESRVTESSISVDETLAGESNSQEESRVPLLQSGNQEANKQELKDEEIKSESLEDTTSESKVTKNLQESCPADNAKNNKEIHEPVKTSNSSKPQDPIMRCLNETLDTKSDASAKYVALISKLQPQFKDSPQLLDPICTELVRLSEINSQLMVSNEQVKSENQKLLLVKEKLENLCRELQKSNNSIRIESLDLIKVEQGKAKEQTAKIQSTLSGVIKLFDENQQRNMSLRQENVDLQGKLKSLLDHCDAWEKSVEATLRQRDLENRLVKTELAKANLIRNEEKKKLLGEKKELLQLLSMMQEQQHKIEGQEAKLRSDLSSYASKYDECQQVISKGMSQFQVESKRMLQQIERSKQDYKSLLSKYETCTKRLTSLLEEKKQWTMSMNKANKKVETLEKLCRALQAKQSSSRSVDLKSSDQHDTKREEEKLTKKQSSSSANVDGKTSKLAVEAAKPAVSQLVDEGEKETNQIATINDSNNQVESINHVESVNLMVGTNSAIKLSFGGDQIDSKNIAL